MKNKLMKRVLMATTVFIAGIWSKPFEVNAAPSTSYVYFEGLLDPGSNELVIKRHDEDRNVLEGAEDKFRTEVKVNLNSTAGNYEYKRRAGNDVYENMLNPHKNMMEKEKPYKRDKTSFEYAMNSWGKDEKLQATGKGGTATKILTVPNAPLYTNTNKKNMFTLQKERMNAIEDALMGQDREGKGLSMVNGFNLILEKIGGLKGGYKDMEDFKKTVMALGWLMGKGNKDDFIIIDPNGYTETNIDEIEDNTEESEGGEDQELGVTDVRVVDTNIKVMITGMGPNKKDLTIQVGPDESPVYKDTFPNLFYKVSTGFTFKYNNYNRSTGSGFMKVVYEDIKTGKTKELFANEGVDGLGSEHVNYIRLYDIVMDALVKAEQKQYDTAGTYGSSNNSFLGKFLFNVLEDFTSNLGITPMEELIYNRTDRATEDKANKNYKYGLYPEAWDKLVSLVQRPAMAISLAFLGFAILKVIFMLNVDAMNVDSRVNVKRDIMNIITAVGGMVLFNIIFIAIISLNYIFVGLIYNVLANGNIDVLDTFMGNATGLIQGTFGDILLGFVSVGVKAYVNVMYIARSVTIAFLLALYPIFMVSAAFSGIDKIKDFIFELVSNVFLQSFHALIFMFITFASQEHSDIFTNTVLMTLLIPMSGAYRELILGKKSGTLQGAAMVGTQASQQVKSMVRTGVGMAAGAAGAAGALAGGGLLFASERKLAGKEVLKNIRSSAGGSGEGGSGEGGSGMEGISKVAEAMAGGGKEGKDSLTLSSLVKDESVTTEDIQAQMDNINSAKGMRNMVNMYQAIKKKDIASVHKLLSENANLNDQHNALAEAKLEKEKYNDELYTARAQYEQMERELPNFTGDGGINYGSPDARTTLTADDLKGVGITDLKQLEGVANTISATFDTNKGEMRPDVPPTLGRAMEQVTAFHNWKSTAVDTSPKAQNEWLKENGGALACVPKEIGNSGKYRVEVNFKTAQLNAIKDGVE